MRIDQPRFETASNYGNCGAIIYMDLLKSKNKEGLILVLNLGSSSLKFSLLHCGSLEKHWSGSVTGIDGSETLMEIDPTEDVVGVKRVLAKTDLENSIREIINWIEESLLRSQIVAIGYRVVQGGPFHILPERITQKMLADLEGFIYLAPNHLPEEIKLMREFIRAYIGIPHIACFDTYFHKDMPDVARQYPLPERYREMGLHRYGFHGLSCESIVQQLLEEDVDVANRKIIIAHLGSGSSMTAIYDGASVDTTMGISPIGGLVMLTRSGDIDPGAILFMLKQDELSVEQLDNILSKESGLLAISGTNDMQKMLVDKNCDERAKRAINLFCYQARKQIGSLASAIGGLDVIIFCGGIGENSHQIRHEICSGLDFMGISIEHSSNVNNDSIISPITAKVTIRVMQTDEETMIAMHVKKILVI